MNALIRNEFAMVEVSVIKTLNGSSLKVQDVRSGSEIILDALELEAFTRASHWQFSSFVDPSWLSVVSGPDPDEE